MYVGYIQEVVDTNTANCLLQVDAWLQKVFAGEPVPAYELNAETLDLLTQLKQANERQEKCNQLIIQDLQLKTDEYRVEGVFDASFVYYIVKIECVL